MNQLAKTDQIQPLGRIERVLVGGDLSSLNEQERINFYKAVCESVGLNPLTKPFEYTNLQGKLTLYARKDCTDQLRKIHGVSVYKLEKELIEDQYVVTAYVKDKTGKEDSDIGVVPIGHLKGNDRANAMMKTVTKAKRRATLSICGLGGMPDEMELETINPLPIIRPEQPPTDGSAGIVGHAGYRIAGGKWSQRSLEEVHREFGAQAMKDYINYLENNAKKTGKPISEGAAEYIREAERFLGFIENAPLSDGTEPDEDTPF